MDRRRLAGLGALALVTGVSPGSVQANSLAPTVRPQISIPRPVQALRTIDLGVKPHVRQDIGQRANCGTIPKYDKTGAIVRERHCRLD